MGTKNNPGKYDCYEKADPDEPIFVLRAKDPYAAAEVRNWAECFFENHRIGGTINEEVREKYFEAMQCAEAMDDWFEIHGGK